MVNLFAVNKSNIKLIVFLCHGAYYDQFSDSHVTTNYMYTIKKWFQFQFILRSFDP
jgi:hypothetical protein